VTFVVASSSAIAKGPFVVGSASELGGGGGSSPGVVGTLGVVPVGGGSFVGAGAGAGVVGSSLAELPPHASALEITQTARAKGNLFWLITGGMLEVVLPTFNAYESLSKNTENA